MPAKLRPITPPYYPIIYVRGYAATMREIEETVGTPYMGFNLGSTKVRQRYADDKPVRFIFESPLIRLMKDEAYTCAYQDGGFVNVDQRVDSRSVWIFRYYEGDSESFGDGKKDTIVSYAEELRAFIARVREQVCQEDKAELAKFKVYLVAHSMGGLICRTYLQNVACDTEHCVDKVFTYATPHGGIEMAGLNAPDLGALDKFHVRNFNRDYMRKYLKLSKDARVTSLDGAFCPNRFFCFVGTNYKDYDAFFGMSRRGTGPHQRRARDDEERGGRRCAARIRPPKPQRAVRDRQLRGGVPEPPPFPIRPSADRRPSGRGRDHAAASGPEAEGRRQADPGPLQHRLVRQGAWRWVLSQRTPRPERSGHPQAVRGLGRGGKPAYLFSGFLLHSAKTSTHDTALAFALEIAIEVPLFEVDRRFWFDEYFEGETLLNETVTLHLRRSGGKATVRYGLRTDVGSGNATKPVALSDPDEYGRMHLEIPLGFKKGLKNPPRPGFRGRLLLMASPWNT